MSITALTVGCEGGKDTIGGEVFATASELL
jgi:hypothetical protein